MGLKIFLGSPCYEWMEPELVGLLIASMDALRHRGHEVLDWGFVKGTLPHFARNTLATEAMSEGYATRVRATRHDIRVALPSQRVAGT